MYKQPLRTALSKQILADFRSDTVTKPTAAMLKAMSAAAVGDDVFQDDPTVNRLEETGRHNPALFSPNNF